MLVLSGNLINKQVLSLRTSTPVGTVKDVIVNPNNLKIEGFYCLDFKKDTMVLVPQDIRETVNEGYIINDHDVLAKVEDLVRLKDVIKIGFNPIGKNIETESGKRLGKVNDFATDLGSFYIMKLHVNQSLIKSFSGGSLIVDRTQIVEITPRKIVVDDELVAETSEAQATVPSV